MTNKDLVNVFYVSVSFNLKSDCWLLKVSFYDDIDFYFLQAHSVLSSF